MFVTAKHVDFMNWNELRLFIANLQVLYTYSKSCQFHLAHADFMVMGTQEGNIDFGS